MCIPTSRPAPTPVPAQSAPVTAATPEFDTSLADVDTASDTMSKKKKGKAGLKVVPKADPSLAIGGGSGASPSASSGVNISN
jgi:hypothetical protein